MISGEAVAGPSVQTIFARRTIFPNQRLLPVYRLQEAIALVLLDVRAVLIHYPELQMNFGQSILNSRKLFR